MMDFARNQSAMVRTAVRDPSNFPLGFSNCEYAECAGQRCIDTLLQTYPTLMVSPASAPASAAGFAPIQLPP